MLVGMAGTSPAIDVEGRAQASDSVKDIRSGEQAMADASSWMPPAGDLRPHVIVRTDGT